MMQARNERFFARLSLLSSDDANTNNAGISSHGRGFFSLGICKRLEQKRCRSRTFGCLAILKHGITRRQVCHDEQPLSPKTNMLANVIFALEFRNALARWTQDNELLQQELHSSRR
jgi:hypothetical protein